MPQECHPELAPDPLAQAAPGLLCDRAFLPSDGEILQGRRQPQDKVTDVKRNAARLKYTGLYLIISELFGVCREPQQSTVRRKEFVQTTFEE